MSPVKTHPRTARLLLITGTDTDVGKTFVACAIAKELRARGRNVGVCKPFAAGVAPGSGADAELLRDAAGVHDAMRDICPVQFAAPLAPNWAARIEAKKVDLAAAEAAIRKFADAYTDIIIEGIGGILCPITDDITFLDFIAPYRPHTIIVALPDLGTLNHTLLTVAALRARQTPILGVLLNAARPVRHKMAADTNAANLRAVLKHVPIFGPIPHRPIGKQADAVIAAAVTAYLGKTPR